jgi:hypothetical protein
MQQQQLNFMKQIPDDVARLAHEQQLVIYDIAQHKPWYRKSGRRIPNLFLLFELADYARNLTS